MSKWHMSCFLATIKIKVCKGGGLHTADVDPLKKREREVTVGVGESSDETSREVKSMSSGV